MPFSEEHRRKISVALKAYAATPSSHLHALHKSGASHPNWQGGVSPKYYKRVSREAHGVACQRCGSHNRTLTHHRDRNRHNSDPSNLELLCFTCHMREHHGKRVAWSCPACGTTLELIPCDASRRRYCSIACKQANRKKDGTYA